MTRTGHEPATIRIAAYWSLPRYALRHGRPHDKAMHVAILTEVKNGTNFRIQCLCCSPVLQYHFSWIQNMFKQSPKLMLS